MTRELFQLMVLSEARLRFRSASTQVVLLVSAMLMWFLITDPASGYAMLAANSARVAYDSTGLALGSSLLITILLGLFGFFLVRGRAGQDLRSGIGNVIAATPASNISLIAGRWVGGVLYLTTLAVVLGMTMMVLQAVRGEGTILPGVFLGFYMLVILPNILFIVSAAMLWESYPPLMGKRGDGLYFLFWLTQIAGVSAWLSLNSGSSPWLIFDSSGLGVVSLRAQQLLQTQSIAIGFNPFDKTLPPILLSHFWTVPMVLMRCATALFAPLPLLLAARLFHRFSPDAVTIGPSRKTSVVLATMRRLLRPFNLLSRLLFRFAVHLPPVAAALLAELAVTIAAYPLTGLLLLLFPAAGAMLPISALPGLMLAAMVYWGVVIAEVSVRDAQADTAAMSATAVGGRNRRYWRQYATAVALAVLLTAPVMARWAMVEPARACTLVAGILMLSAWAQALGCSTRTGRVFTVLFLFGMYLCSQSPALPVLDVLGMHGTATTASIAREFSLGMVVLLAGFAFHRRREV